MNKDWCPVREKLQVQQLGDLWSIAFREHYCFAETAPLWSLWNGQNFWTALAAASNMRHSLHALTLKTNFYSHARKTLTRFQNMWYSVIVWKTYKRTHQLKSGIRKRSNSPRAPSMRGNFNPLSTFECVVCARLPMPPPTLKLGIAVVQCAWGVRSVLSPTRPLPPYSQPLFLSSWRVA